VARLFRRAGLVEGKRWALVAQLAYPKCRIIARALDGERGRQWWFRADSVQRYIDRHGPKARRDAA